MAYVKAHGGQTTYPYSIGQLRKDNPNTSFPSRISDETLASYGVYAVTVAAEPTYDPSTHKLERGALPVDVNGVWLLPCNVVPLSADEIAERDAAAGSKVRDERDRRLAASDWIIIRETERAAADGLGLQVPIVWLNYRQALRDIPSQAGFPHNVTWPSEP